MNFNEGHSVIYLNTDIGDVYGDPILTLEVCIHTCRHLSEIIIVYYFSKSVFRYQSSIGEEKKKNIQIQSHTTKEEFVSFRTNRDKILAAPKLLLPSVQVNIDAGHLPAPDTNGTHYLKIPIG